MSGVILFTGNPASGTLSYAQALKEILTREGLRSAILEESKFPLLIPGKEPEWSTGVLSAALVLNEMGYFVLIPIQLNDEQSIKNARLFFTLFKEVYFKSPQGLLGRRPQLPELAIYSENFEKDLKQILDWLTREKIVSLERADKNSPVTAGTSSEEAQHIREKLKSLGYL